MCVYTRCTWWSMFPNPSCTWDSSPISHRRRNCHPTVSLIHFAAAKDLVAFWGQIPHVCLLSLRFGCWGWCFLLSGDWGYWGIQPKYCPTPLPQTPLLISWPARFFFGHALSMKWVSFFFFWTNHSLDKECIERNFPAINSNVYIFYFTKTRLWNFYRFIWKCCSWSVSVFRCVVAQTTVCLFKH